MANDNFSPTSRYYSIETTTLTGADGEPLPYLRRRFLPPSSRFALLREHLVLGGERLDRIAAQEIGDPELFWRLCDANDAMQPEELTAVVGRRLRVTLPEGIPGLTGA
ncbi:MAG TPA: LysM domain-containing protein [Caldimonas sp.]|jgi:hypothetical protein